MLPGSDVTVVPHLYDLTADGATLEWLRAVPGDLVVLSWLYPRSTFWLLDANGVRGRFGRTSSLGEEELDDAMTRSHQRAPVPDRTIWCFDLRTHEQPGAFVREIARLAGEDAAGPWAEAAVPIEGKTGDVREITEAARERWYPVIDFSRCNDCLECLNFCLFGVFGLDEADRPWIEQPDACRPGCPACARICPSGAIMFPQHTDPAIAGDLRASREALKLDLSQLFRGLTPAELAAAERARALADQRGAAAPPGGQRRR
jgi:NAD-dependent dihydropyrimidine dehydrogenase PreA subunit